MNSQVQTTTTPTIDKLAVTAPVATGTPVKASGDISVAGSVALSKQVKSYFKDIPALVGVAWCESRDRQTDSDGNIFRGAANNKDVGVMQINESYHLEKAKSLGMDIYTLSGNMAYARYLYERQGLAPWSSSAPCWGSDKVSPNEVALK